MIALLRGINVGSHNRIAMAELRELLASLGYSDARTLVQSGNIVLTADMPDLAAIEEILAIDFAPERFVCSGREIYAWHPQGIHSSLLARRLSDKRLGVTVTARNWKTTTKLLKMAEELET